MRQQELMRVDEARDAARADNNTTKWDLATDALALKAKNNKGPAWKDGKWGTSSKWDKATVEYEWTAKHKKWDDQW